MRAVAVRAAVVKGLAAVRAVLRVLTPGGWSSVVVVVAAIVVLAVGPGRWLVGGLGLHWDPFGSQAKRLAQAERAAEVAVADAAARTAEAVAERLQQERIRLQQDAARGAVSATGIAAAQARSANDADNPIDAARAARLHAHDRELCRLAAESGGLDGCPAAPDPA